MGAEDSGCSCFGCLARGLEELQLVGISGPVRGELQVDCFVPVEDFERSDEVLLTDCRSSSGAVEIVRLFDLSLFLLVGCLLSWPEIIVV